MVTRGVKENEKAPWMTWEQVRQGCLVLLDMHEFCEGKISVLKRFKA